MNYWWVNINKTRDTALSEGYLWSPKTKKDSRPIYLAYEVMKEPKQGDILIANARNYIVAVGVILNPAYDSIKPIEFAEEENWQTEGYRIDVQFTDIKGDFKIADFPRQELIDLESSKKKYFPISVKTSYANMGYLFPVQQDFFDYLKTKIRELSNGSLFQPPEEGNNLNIIQNILDEYQEKGPLHYEDIVDLALNKKLLSSDKKTVSRTFNRLLNQNLTSRFNSHGGGLYSSRRIAKPTSYTRISTSPYIPNGTIQAGPDKLVPSGNSKRVSGYNSHSEMEKVISSHLTAIGRNAERVPIGPRVDLTWKTEKTFSILEVKSIRKANERHQMRLGIGQLCEYREAFNRLGRKVDNCYLAVTDKPSLPNWEDICETVGITLITPSNFRKKLK